MRELEIDWSTLHSAFAMSMPEVRCFLCANDGKVAKLAPGDPNLNEVRGSPETYLAVEAVPSRIQYQWLDSFIKSIEEEDLRTRLEAAINGKGAFRRFKDILLTLPEERSRWFEYRDHLMRQYIVQWVLDKGVKPLNDPPWTDQGIPIAKPVNDSVDLQRLRDTIDSWLEGQGPEISLSLEGRDALVERIDEQFQVKPIPEE